MSVAAGPDGTPDGDNGDSKRYGYLAGLPNPARMELDSFNKPCSYPKDFPSHTQSDGKDAIGPTAPKHVGVSGRSSFTVVPSQSRPRSKFDRTYFALKNKLIRDQYINADTTREDTSNPNRVNLGYTQTAQLIVDLERSFAAHGDLQSATTTDPGLVAEWSKFEAMRNNIQMQKNYFGRGLHDAPIYAFSFASDRYETQIDSVSNLLYLSRNFAEVYAKNKAVQQSDIQKIVSAQNAIIQDEAQYEINSNAIDKIGVQLTNVLNTISQLQKDLDRVKAYISADAAETESEKQNKLNAIKVFTTVCAVIPVGQPVWELGVKS